MESITEQISDKSEPAIFEDIVYVALRIIKYECGREYQSDYYTVIPHEAVYLAENDAAAEAAGGRDNHEREVLEPCPVERRRDKVEQQYHNREIRKPF